MIAAYAFLWAIVRPLSILGNQSLGVHFVTVSEGDLSMNLLKRSAALGLMLAFAAGVATTAPAMAQSVTINVNGQTVNFDQPPVERAGRVFVPLRGVFERLCASVVYANGQINAQGNGRSVSLHIGSHTAMVNGQSVGMDVAPFLVGARTLVPLRFVAQALGATVNYDNGSRTVYINGSGGSQSSTPTTPSNASFNLRNMRPASSTSTVNPAIHANFSEPVNRDSIHVSIDGRDVTNEVYANANGFDVTAPFALSTGTHAVRVTGTTQAGSSFDTHWSFTTSNGVATNFVRNLTPAPGGHVGGNFTISGNTLPGSKVHIVASGEASALGGLFQMGTGTFTTDVTADASGRFTAPVSINAVSGGQVRVILQSTSPDGSSIERSIVYGS